MRVSEQLRRRDVELYDPFLAAQSGILMNFLAFDHRQNALLKMYCLRAIPVRNLLSAIYVPRARSVLHTA